MSETRLAALLFLSLMPWALEASASNCSGVDPWTPFPSATLDTSDGRALCGNPPSAPYCTVEGTHQAPLGEPGFGYDFVQVRVRDNSFYCGTAASFSKQTWNNVAAPHFKLHPADSCDLKANLGPALAEVAVKGVLDGQPVAVLRAVQNPCDQANPGGCTTIYWETAQITEPWVQVRVGDTGPIFQCRTANQPHSALTWSALVKPTFKLQVVTGCTSYAGCCAAVDPSLVTPLAQLTVAGTDSLPVCSLDGRTMKRVEGDFLGIISNELHRYREPHRVAEKMQEAGVAYQRSNVRWWKVQPFDPAVHEYPPGDDFYWADHDRLFASFVAEGVQPWITLMQTPLWASPIERGVDGPPESCIDGPTYEESFGCCQACTQGFPCDGFCRFAPTDLELWKDYVRAVVERYGTGQTIDGGPYGVQTLKVDNWDLWLEPVHSLQAAPGQPAEGWVNDYLALLQAAHEVIDEIRNRSVGGNPDLKIWGPDAIVYRPTLSEPGNRCFRDFVREVLDQGRQYLDGLSVHLFHEDVEGMVQGFRLMRALADQYDPDLPMAVTAVQLAAEDNCPYSEDTTGELRAKSLNDMYVCLANEGARHVFWYKSSERFRSICPGGLEKSGVLSPFEPFPDGYVPNSAYDALQAIGDFIAVTGY